MSRPTVDAGNVEIIVQGDLPGNVRDYALDRIATLAEHASEPILHARIRLTHQPDPAVDRPVRAQVNLDLNGRPVRAQAAATTGHQAVDLLVQRLNNRLPRLARHWEALRGRRPTAQPHEWRHGAEPAHRPPYYPRPVEEREIIRHKSYAPARITPSEAAWEMDQMDYDFHLFIEAATGRDALVYRGGPTGYRLARVADGPARLPQTDPEFTLSPSPAPQLTVTEATDRLEVTGWPFVFFADASAHRGNVLYHRYDGHYGLIAPAR